MPASKRARIEPWPFFIAALLAAMIGVSIGFLRIALDHPDAPAVEAAASPARGAPR
jgi:hypothetical protein